MSEELIQKSRKATLTFYSNWSISPVCIAWIFSLIFSLDQSHHFINNNVFITFSENRFLIGLAGIPQFIFVSTISLSVKQAAASSFRKLPPYRISYFLIIISFQGSFKNGVVVV